MDEAPYYYHALRITAPGKKSRYYRKVARAEAVLQVLIDIAKMAFYANSLFDASLEVEQTVSKIPDGTAMSVEQEEAIDDERYVESDKPKSDLDDMLQLPDIDFWHVK